MSYKTWKSIMDEYRSISLDTQDWAERRARAAKSTALYDAAAWAADEPVPSGICNRDRADYIESQQRRRVLISDAKKSEMQKLHDLLLLEASHKNFMADNELSLAEKSGEPADTAKVSGYRQAAELISKAAELMRRA